MKKAWLKKLRRALSKSSVVLNKITKTINFIKELIKWVS